MTSEKITIQIESCEDNGKSKVKKVRSNDLDLEMGSIEKSANNNSMELLVPLVRADTNVSLKSSIKSSISSSANRCKTFFSWLFNFISTTKVFWIVVLYTIVGAYIFMWLEVPVDLAAKQEAHEYHLVARDVLLFKINQVHKGRILEKDQHWKQAIIEFEQNAGFQSPGLDTSWTFWMAILYCATIYTTVGYGNISCVTTAGRVTTIFYAMFGIPLMFVVLDQLGSFFLKRMRAFTYFLDDFIFFIGVRLKFVHLKDQHALIRYIGVCKKLAKWRLIRSTISISVTDEGIAEEDDSLASSSATIKTYRSIDDYEERRSLKYAQTKGSILNPYETIAQDYLDDANFLRVEDASLAPPSRKGSLAPSSRKASTTTIHLRVEDAEELLSKSSGKFSIASSSGVELEEETKNMETDSDRALNNKKQSYAAYDDQTKRSPPILTAFLITMGWIAFSAAVFCLWEDWTYFTSVYFFFISMSTIGFGDVTPRHPEYMIATFFVVIVGLSLVSVCINVAQEKFSQIYMDFLDKMLQQYLKAQASGDVDAIRGAMAGFSSRTRFLMPFISKNQGIKLMNQFKEEARAMGVELPGVMTELNQAGKPAFCTIFDQNSDTRVNEFLEKAQNQGKMKRNAHTQTKFPIQRAHKFFISKAEADRESFEVQTDYFKQEAQIQTEQVSNRSVGIQHSKELHDSSTQFIDATVYVDKNTNTLKIESSSTGIQPEVSCILNIIDSGDEFYSSESDEYDNKKEANFDTEEMKDESKMIDLGSDQAMRDGRIKAGGLIKSSYLRSSHEVLSKVGESYSKQREEMHLTQRAVAFEGGDDEKSINHDESKQDMDQTGKDQRKSGKNRRKRFSGLRYMRNVGIQASGAGVDGGKIVDEPEKKFQTKRVQTIKPAVTSRQVQTQLTSTFKHKQERKITKIKLTEKAENVTKAKDLLAEQREELKKVFQLNDQEIDRLQSRIKKVKKKYLQRQYSTEGDEPPSQTSLEEEFLEEDRQNLLNEIKLIYEEKQNALKSGEASEGEEVEEEEEDEDKPKPEKDVLFKKPEEFTLQISQPSERGHIIRENYEETILDIQLVKSPFFETRYLPQAEEQRISESAQKAIRLPKKREKKEKINVDFEQLLEHLTQFDRTATSIGKQILSEEDFGFGIDNDDGNLDIELFSTEVFTQTDWNETDWNETELFDKLRERGIPAKSIHQIKQKLDESAPVLEVLAQLVEHDIQTFDKFTQTGESHDLASTPISEVGSMEMVYQKKIDELEPKLSKKKSIIQRVSEFLHARPQLTRSRSSSIVRDTSIKQIISPSASPTQHQPTLKESEQQFLDQLSSEMSTREVIEKEEIELTIDNNSELQLQIKEQKIEQINFGNILTFKEEEKDGSEKRVDFDKLDVDIAEEGRGRLVRFNKEDMLVPIPIDTKQVAAYKSSNEIVERKKAEMKNEPEIGVRKVPKMPSKFKGRKIEKLVFQFEGANQSNVEEKQFLEDEKQIKIVENSDGESAVQLSHSLIQNPLSEGTDTVQTNEKWPWDVNIEELPMFGVSERRETLKKKGESLISSLHQLFQQPTFRSIEEFQEQQLLIPAMEMAKFLRQHSLNQNTQGSSSQQIAQSNLELDFDPHSVVFVKTPSGIEPRRILDWTATTSFAESDGAKTPLQQSNRVELVPLSDHEQRQLRDWIALSGQNPNESLINITDFKVQPGGKLIRLPSGGVHFIPSTSIGWSTITNVKDSTSRLSSTQQPCQSSATSSKYTSYTDQSRFTFPRNLSNLDRQKLMENLERTQQIDFKESMSLPQGLFIPWPKPPSPCSLANQPERIQFYRKFFENNGEADDALDYSNFPLRDTSGFFTEKLDERRRAIERMNEQLRQERQQKLLTQLKDEPERKDRMIDVGIQGGVLSRVVHLFEESDEEDDQPGTSSTDFTYVTSPRFPIARVRLNQPGAQPLISLSEEDQEDEDQA